MVGDTRFYVQSPILIGSYWKLKYGVLKPDDDNGFFGYAPYPIKIWIHLVKNFSHEMLSKDGCGDFFAN